MLVRPSTNMIIIAFRHASSQFPPPSPPSPPPPHFPRPALPLSRSSAFPSPATTPTRAGVRAGSRRLVSTSFDDTVRIWDAAAAAAAALAPVTSIRHDNNTGRWVLPFRAIWTAAGDGVIIGRCRWAGGWVGGH